MQEPVLLCSVSCSQPPLRGMGCVAVITPWSMSLSLGFLETVLLDLWSPLHQISIYEAQRTRASLSVDRFTVGKRAALFL